MVTREIAAQDVQRADVILQEARSLLDRGAWSLVVRRGQEAVELALKGALRWAGVEVPKVHDVGPHLLRHADRFPVWFTDDLPRLSEISGRLRREREASFYGDEASGVAPEAMYDEADAKEALAEATFVLDRCRHLVQGD